MKFIICILTVVLLLNVSAFAEEVIVPTPAWKAFQAGVGTITSSAKALTLRSNTTVNIHIINFICLVSLQGSRRILTCAGAGRLISVAHSVFGDPFLYSFLLLFDFMEVLH